MTTLTWEPVFQTRKTRTFTILIVEDNPTETEHLLQALERANLKPVEGGLDFEVCSTAKGALQALTERAVDLVLTDVVLPGVDGLDLISRIQELDRTLPVIVVTQRNEVGAAVEAMRRGAYDYIVQPANPDDLGMRLHRAIRISEIVRRRVVYQRVQEREFDEGGFIGASKAFHEILRTVRAAAQGRMPVLIIGETGTGKGLIARRIHEESSERTKPYQVIDCTTLPEGMAESELFGHVRGAFTGAISDKPGLIELAHGGTAFLDEIGDLPLPLQAKLLRVLEDNEVRPVGGTRVKRVDMRFIAATNKDLEEKVQTGEFRKDLYYRLAAFVIKVPPLRERPEDIAVLARHFTSSFGQALKKPGCYLESSAMNELAAYDWPGNVRELRNVIERAIMLCEGNTISRQQIRSLLPSGRKSAASFDITAYLADSYGQARKKVLAEFNSAYLRAKLEMAGGQVAKAAEDSGITRQHFSSLMRHYLQGSSPSAH
ncbi:sigma-54-dependent transcriptional regulator [Nitrospira sp. Kam-Ns4a]